MSDTNTMFESASRLKLRYDTPQGYLSVEDLWSLPLTSKASRANLDDIARGLHHELKDDAVSFVTESKADESSQLAFKIVRHVIAVRLNERKQADEAKARADRKKQILSIIAKKEDEKLEGLSLDELRGLIEGM